MNRSNKEQYIFGSILLLSNKLEAYGNKFIKDITMKQWFLLMLISKMESKNPTIKEIADFSGTTRQNIKQIINPLAKKNYLKIEKSSIDARALNISLTSKTFKFFSDYENIAKECSSNVFSDISIDLLDNTIETLNKLMNFFDKEKKENKQ